MLARKGADGDIPIQDLCATCTNSPSASLQSEVDGTTKLCWKETIDMMGHHAMTHPLCDLFGGLPLMFYYPSTGTRGTCFSQSGSAQSPPIVDFSTSNSNPSTHYRVMISSRGSKSVSMTSDYFDGLCSQPLRPAIFCRAECTFLP